MNQTRLRGYPYPQCDPPYVKDVADAPAQLKALAEAVEADVQALDTALQSAAFPPAVLVSNTTVQNLAPGDRFNLTTLEYGNAAYFDNGNDALLIPETALYHLSAWGQTNAMTTDYVRFSLLRNGASLARDNRLPNQSGVGSNVRTNVHCFALLSAGDRITVTQDHDDATAPWNMIYAGFARICEL